MTTCLLTVEELLRTLQKAWFFLKLTPMSGGGGHEEVGVLCQDFQAALQAAALKKVRLRYSVVWKNTSPGALQGARSHYWAPCTAPQSKENWDFFRSRYNWSNYKEVNLRILR